MAVQILQRYAFDGADDPTMEEHVEEMQEVSSEYRHLCSLVAMCIAGYSGAGASDNESSWSSLCRQVINKLQKTTVTRPSGNHNYFLSHYFILLSLLSLLLLLPLLFQLIILFPTHISHGLRN